jgi:hypothetical protein
MLREEVVNRFDKQGFTVLPEFESELAKLPVSGRVERCRQFLSADPGGGIKAGAPRSLKEMSAPRSVPPVRAAPPSASFPRGSGARIINC